MTLERVTITGADDDTDLAGMAELSRAFPFVEWGILASASRAGLSRYPSPERRETICRAAERGAMKLSLHLCGLLSRRTTDDYPPLVIADGYDRAQINGFYPANRIRAFTKANRAVEIILQARSAGHELDATAAVARSILDAGGRASVLYDPSGGRGQRAVHCPTPPAGVSMGYAGGIGPDNVRAVLEGITRITDAPFWIDMESHVRSRRLHAPEDDDGRLDLGLVRRVLEQAALFVKQGA